MFVYNNFTADARVTKEARSLIEAGYEVEVVAVLDKRTVPTEERDGIRIVRIDRRPPHYRLLWFSRRVRRWLRLCKAKTKRSLRLLREKVERSLRLLWKRIERRARLLRKRLERRRQLIRRRARGRDRLSALALPGRVAVAPFARVYRAVRWRLLLRSETLRRAYYRRRARAQRRRELRRAWTRRDATETRKASPGRALQTGGRILRRGVWLLLLALAAPAWIVARALRATLRLLPRAGRAIDRAVSHACHRAVMVFHRPLMFSDYWIRAYRHVRNRGFDVFHAHDLNTLPVAAALARATGRRLIYDSHELYTEVSTLSRLERTVWRVFERALIGRADSVVTVCESIAGELSDRYGIEKPLVVLNCPNESAVPRSRPERNVLRERAGLLDSKEPIVLYQGGFAVHRGLPELIEAARHLSRGVVVLMGWGQLEGELREKIAADGLEDRVVIIGPATPEELPVVTAGADVGVIPYQAVGLNNYYTTPNKLFEYIASGIAVAGSHFPELCRIIETYEIGVTFDPHQPRGMARAINELLENPELLATMRANTAAAAGELVWERQVTGLLDLYGRLAPTPATDRVAA